MCAEADANVHELASHVVNSRPIDPSENGLADMNVVLRSLLEAADMTVVLHSL